MNPLSPLLKVCARITSAGSIATIAIVVIEAMFLATAYVIGVAVWTTLNPLSGLVTGLFIFFLEQSLIPLILDAFWRTERPWVEIEWERPISIREIQLAADDQRESDSARVLYALVISELENIVVPNCLKLEAFVYADGIGFDFVSCPDQTNCTVNRTLRLDIDDSTLAYGRDDTGQCCMPLRMEGCMDRTNIACPEFWSGFRKWIHQECREYVADFGPTLHTKGINKSEKVTDTFCGIPNTQVMTHDRELPSYSRNQKEAEEVVRGNDG